MIPAQIQTIFGTLFVGILAIALVWAVVRAYRPYGTAIGRAIFLQIERLRSYSLVLGTLLVLISFGIGVFAEGGADYLVDVETEFAKGPVDRISYCQRQLLGTERHHRFLALFKKKKEKDRKDPEYYYKATGLGREVFQNDQYLLSAINTEKKAELKFLKNREKVRVSTDGSSLLDFWPGLVYAISCPFTSKDDKIEAVASTEDDSTVDQSTAEAVVNRLYYPAKNWNYGQDTYFIELREIEKRLEWARSSFLLISWAVILSIPAVAWRLMRLIVAWFGGQLWRKNDAARALGRSSLIVVGMILVGVPATGAYRDAERLFNERAFGYYVSHLSREEGKRKFISPGRDDALVWMHSSAEYAALSLQTFNVALEEIIRRTENQTNGKPAVVIDIDETVLDNLAFQRWLRQNGWSYSEGRWSYWIDVYRGDVDLVPGAKRFIEQLRKENIHIVFISNRLEASLAITQETLYRLGVLPTPDAGEEEGFLFLLKRDELSKNNRREELAKRGYHVLAYIGDNLADFDKQFEHDESELAQDRYRKACDERDRWGSEWFVLPNPIYGGWQSYSRSQDLDQLFGQPGAFTCD